MIGLNLTLIFVNYIHHNPIVTQSNLHCGLLQEEERKMRSLAVVTPMMLDARQRSLRFVNKNGLIEDCMEEYKERKYFNVWTATEKQIFKEKYLQHPKNFGLIASFLEKKVN